MSFKLQFEKLQSKLDTRRAILSLQREDKLKLVKTINLKRDKKTNYFDPKKIKRHKLTVEIGYGQMHDEQFDVFKVGEDSCTKDAILYFYDSHFVFRPALIEFDRAIKLNKATGNDVYIPKYPLLPNYSIRDVVRVLFTALRKVNKLGYENIYLYGVGTGATLAIETLVYNNEKEVSVPMPKRLILISPGGFPKNEKEWEDMKAAQKMDYTTSLRHILEIKELATLKNPSVPDYMITGENLNLNGFPESFFFYSDEEICYGKFDNYKEQFEEAGIKTQFTVRHGVLHNYCADKKYPEAYEDYDAIIELLKR